MKIRVDKCFECHGRIIEEYINNDGRKDFRRCSSCKGTGNYVFVEDAPPDLTVGKAVLHEGPFKLSWDFITRKVLSERRCPFCDKEIKDMGGHWYCPNHGCVCGDCFTYHHGTMDNCGNCDIIAERLGIEIEEEKKDA